jgi:hypothetical protein
MNILSNKIMREIGCVYIEIEKNISKTLSEVKLKVCTLLLYYFSIFFMVFYSSTFSIFILFLLLRFF